MGVIHGAAGAEDAEEEKAEGRRTEMTEGRTLRLDEGMKGRKQ